MNLPQSIEPNGVISPVVNELQPVNKCCDKCGYKLLSFRNPSYNYTYCRNLNCSHKTPI